MKNARELLSYDEVEPLFLREMRSEKAKSAFKSLSFLSLEEARRERSEMTMAADIMRHIDLPLEVSFDLSSYVERANKGGSLTSEELYRVKVECDNRDKIVKAFLGEELPRNAILELGRNLPELSYLSKAIDRAIGADLKIKDRASGKLYAVRMSLRGIDGEMKQALEKELRTKAEFLSSPLPSLRNGKMVLAVKNAYKSKVGGAIIASSSSGETVFVEPYSLLALEEKKERLLREEKEECDRILLELSGTVSSFAEPLTKANSDIGRLDFLFAKVRYMNRVKGSIPEVGEGKELRLIKARHPLLFEKAVPNDFELSAERPILVISGPNAGGKTVALKTVGLLSYMARLGLPIPAEEGSLVPLYSSIGADIGDQQSLEESLSTFSGHLSGLRDAIKDVGPSTLLLLDELGTGTAPKEGEAIAYGVIVYLEKKGAEAVVSSHFEGIKALAVSGGKVRNASMAYDEKDSRPTYRLRMDIPGESYGLSLAKRFLPAEAIIHALSGSSKLHEAIKAKKDLDFLFEEKEEPSAALSERKKEPLKVGDYAKVPSMGLEGRVESLGRNVAIRTSSGALFKVASSLAEKAVAPVSKKEPMSGRLLDEDSFRESVPLELNLIGMRAAEAESALDLYVDKVTLKGFSRVRIIHGFGGGTLRRVVLDYAKAHPDRVKRVEAAGESEGMGGATIFYLK